MTGLPRVVSIVSIIMMSSVACQMRDFERSFFSESLANRVERARELTLEQQYKVFRYGNDVIHPPLMELADPIAERGASAVPFLLEQLEADQDDLATRDVLLIFKRMAALKTYDVKSDGVVMGTLSARVGKIRNSEWQAISQRMLTSIRDS